MLLRNGLKVVAPIKIDDVWYAWDSLAQQDVRDRLGITEVPNIPRPDPHLYDSTENEDGSWTSVDRDPALIAEEDAVTAKVAKDLSDAQAARQYAKLQALSQMSPAQIQTWVTNNVTDFASAKDAIKTLAIAVSVLARRL